MNTILSTPVKVGMCFGVPYNEGIYMVLIISISATPSEMFVRYAYFSSGTVVIERGTFHTQNYQGNEVVLIRQLWDNEKIVLL